MAYTWDKGSRLTQVQDSIGGTITRVYDGLNRLTSETTGQGTVSYTYDAAGRRATMTVPGQSQVSYTFDVANRLTTITQGSAVTSLGYDNVNRRTSLTLPLLQAEPGVTALAGRVLATDGTPLRGVKISEGLIKTETDAFGRFLLRDLHAG